MQGHYGSRFLNMWKTGQVLPDGSDAGVVNAMDHWSKKLAGYADSPETIKRTLENLPPEPPSLPQFCELMRQNYIHKAPLAIGRQHTQQEMEANKKKLAALLTTLKAHKGVLNDVEHD